MQTPTLSIVVPVFNEAGNVRTLYDRLVAVLEPLAIPWELIPVDDGSGDGTLDELLRLQATDPRVRPISFSRNFGHQVALTAGLDAARGAAVICMDGDLQHPPEVLPELLTKWREGYDVVQTVRTDTAKVGALKRLTSALFYRFINWVSDTPIQPNAADFRLLSREALDALLQCRERDRFVRGLVSWVGFRRAEVPFVAGERLSGTTKYSLAQMMRLAFDALTAFSTKPLKLATSAGFAAAVLGVIYALYTAYVRLFTENAVPGWASLTVSVLVLGGLQLICLGLIAEYIARLLHEAKARPLYITRNLDRGRADIVPGPDKDE